MSKFMLSQIAYPSTSFTPQMAEKALFSESMASTSPGIFNPALRAWQRVMGSCRWPSLRTPVVQKQMLVYVIGTNNFLNKEHVVLATTD